MVASPAVANPFERCALDVEAACAEAATASATASEVAMNVRMAGAMVSQIHHGLEAVVASTDASRGAVVDALAQVATTDAAIRVLSQLGAEIGSMIETISRLAQQTRMVALNAKIEAVHAGVHGRAFAAVAEEVKALAKDSALAADKITDHIEAIGRAVSGAANAMCAANAGVGRITALVDEIATAVQEQRGQAEVVNTYVGEAVASVESIGLHIDHAGEVLGAVVTQIRSAACE